MSSSHPAILPEAEEAGIRALLDEPAGVVPWDQVPGHIQALLDYAGKLVPRHRDLLPDRTKLDFEDTLARLQDAVRALRRAHRID